jgi:hypothetical protein
VYDIRHRVGIAAPAPAVREAVSTRDGISSWWTHDVRDDAGDGLSFYFGQPEPAAVMQVTTGPDTVTWRCVNGPGEWVGTTLTFGLRADGEETVVLDTHAGWRDPAEFMHHCSTKWAYFLLSLKSSLVGGPSTAYPGDLAISSWG